MCLVSAVVGVHPEYPLVFAGNRDEYHARDSTAADWWKDKPVLAGRDLVAGGTWLGINKSGRFAVVTNRPDLPPPAKDPHSRGALPLRWLSNEPMLPWLEDCHELMGGFSLCTFAHDQLTVYSGGLGASRLKLSTIRHGVFGLSNTAIDQPWPKLNWLNTELLAHTEKSALAGEAPQAEDLLALLTRTDPVPGSISQGVPATPFVLGESYGTRCSTVVLIRQDGQCTLHERRFGPNGLKSGESTYSFSL